MIAAGIDLGGTKIALQGFDESWQKTHEHRVSTPRDYPGLVAALADLVRQADAWAGQPIPVGIGAAGLLNPATGLALTANLCATGKPLPADVSRAAGRPVPYYNDCRTLALSEAIFGAGQGRDTVASLILGTGVGGGVALRGQLLPSPSSTGGEFGHTAAPAHLTRDLGLHRCGCGAMACIETFIAGPGLARMAFEMTGRQISPPEIAANRDDPAIAPVFSLWLDLVTSLLRDLTLTVDPDIIVLGGGLSRIEGLVPALQARLKAAQIGDFPVPELALAQGGEASGARGAAYAAWLDARQTAPAPYLTPEAEETP